MLHFIGSGFKEPEVSRMEDVEASIGEGDLIASSHYFNKILDIFGMNNHDDLLSQGDVAVSKLKHLDFLQVAKIYSLQDFWSIKTGPKARYFIVRDVEDVEKIKGSDGNVVPVSQIKDIPLGPQTELHLSRQVIGALLCQAQSAVEYLLDQIEESEQSFHRSISELKEKVTKEEDNHINSVKNFSQRNHELGIQNKSLQQTLEDMSKELHKYQTLEKYKKKKDLLDELCKENEALKRQVEVLDAQLQSYGHTEDLT